MAERGGYKLTSDESTFRRPADSQCVNPEGETAAGGSIAEQPCSSMG